MLLAPINLRKDPFIPLRSPSLPFPLPYASKAPTLLLTLPNPSPPHHLFPKFKPMSGTTVATRATPLQFEQCCTSLHTLNMRSQHHYISIYMRELTFEAPCVHNLNLLGSTRVWLPCCAVVLWCIDLLMWVLFGSHDDVVGMVVVMAVCDTIMVEVWGCEAQRKNKRQTETQFHCTLHSEIMFSFFFTPLENYENTILLYNIQWNHVCVVYFFCTSSVNYKNTILLYN